MVTGIAVRPAEDDDLEYVERVLAANELPTEDVRDGPGEFYVASVHDDPVGVGGIERHGSVGLLRSVVVEDSARGNGYGSAICDELETRARGDGLDALYLLTTTARDFFTDRGYRVVERTDVPAEIEATTEFSELCPSSATCMVAELGE